MNHRPRKLGILLSGAPEAAPFGQGVRLATAALEKGCDVYLYCIDLAVKGVGQPDLQKLKTKGLKLYACAYGAHRHGIPVDDSAIFAGLTVVNDLISNTDRFVGFP